MGNQVKERLFEAKACGLPYNHICDNETMLRKLNGIINSDPSVDGGFLLRSKLLINNDPFIAEAFYLRSKLFGKPDISGKLLKLNNLLRADPSNNDASFQRWLLLGEDEDVDTFKSPEDLALEDAKAAFAIDPTNIDYARQMDEAYKAAKKQ